MKKKYVLASLAIMSLLFLVGLMMLFRTTEIGQNAGNREMRARGGSMDTQQLYNVIDSTTENFRTAGMIISLVGGLGVLLGGCGVYKEM